MGLSLKLLGEFSVRDGNGTGLSLPTRKMQALLAYLAVNVNAPQRRERLMALLWSDFGEKQARHNLNQALLSLRKLASGTGVSLLDGNTEHITLCGDAIDIDLTRFRTLQAIDPAAAADLYEGPFLDGLTVRDPAFDEWMTATRSELHVQACDTLQRAADAAAENGDPGSAITCMRRLVSLDALREDAHRRLMGLLYESGDRTGALRQYQNCADILKRELQIEPDAATSALCNKIRNGTAVSSASENSPQLTASSAATVTQSPRRRPSVAVLPFKNMSDSREFEFLADGFTEDVTMLLARIPGFFVISRNSSFAFKGKTPDVREVARDLGVRYVVEGSLRPLGPRIRITAQLTEAVAGNHLWATRFDRPVDEIYDVQDEVVTGIMAQLEPELTRAEFEKVRRRAPADMNAWAYYQKAHGLLSLKGWRRETFAEATDLLNHAIDLDPQLAVAHAYLALIHALGHMFRLSSDGEDSETLAIAAAETAIEIDNQNSKVLGYVGCALCDIGHTNRGIDILERAVEIDPSNAQSWVALGVGLMSQGKVKRGVEMLEHGMRISPLDHNSAYWGTNLANALYRLGRVDEALEAVTLACRRDEKLEMARVVLAMILHGLGRKREAQEAMAEAFRINGDLGIEQIQIIVGRRGVQILQTAGLLNRKKK
jgi:adenylate cyclase